MSKVTVEDALSYLDKVNSEFIDRPHILKEFLHIVTAHKEQKLDALGVIRRVSTLFCGKQELLLGLNVFLPESYRIEFPQNGPPVAVCRAPGGTLPQTVLRFATNTTSSESRDESVTHEEAKMQLEISGTAKITPSSKNDPTTKHAEDDKQESEGSRTTNGDGSISYQLYQPSVELDDVVIPRETKKRVRDAIASFEKVKDKYYEHEVKRRKNFHGLGLSLLFYGSSGTGKTMLANAIAAELGKKIMVVNFPNIDNKTACSVLEALFQEARTNDAVVFFDDCEFLCEERTKSGGSSVNILCAELDRFDGLCVLATNLPDELDDSIRRRISLAVEFRQPDCNMREELWKVLRPPTAVLETDVNFAMIARKYELTGGHIKNAWRQSLGAMAQRGGDKITQEDLLQAAGEQVTGLLSSDDFYRHVTPTHGLKSVVLPPAIKDCLVSVVQDTKAQSVLFEWGFNKIHRSTSGITVLLTGIPGTGKTMAAEAVGYDLGRTLLVVNVAELLSKWVGETGKNIQEVFADAKKKDAVLVFDEAEGLFGARSNESTDCSRHDTMNVGLLLQYIENHPGVVIVITNMKNAIDGAFFRRFRFVLDFDMPDALQREELWKTQVPPECPLASNVSFRELAARYAMCGGDIKNSLRLAATKAALRADENDRVVTMSDLTWACDAEMRKKGGRKSSDLSMYS